MRNAVLLGAALITGSNAALAQNSGLQIYGSIDDSIQYVSNARGSSSWGEVASAVPEFFGFRGTENLGGGMTAMFRLENGFLSDSGKATAPSLSFSRLAYVGLSSQLGMVTLGRQYELSTDSLQPMSNAFLQYDYQLFHPGNLDSLGVVSLNNTVRYTTPTYAGLSGMVQYGFDDATTQPGSYVGVAVNYKGGPLRVGAVWSRQHDRIIDFRNVLGYSSFLGQTLAPGATYEAETSETAGVGALYQFSQKWSVHGVYTRVGLRGFGGASTSMQTLEAGVNFSPTSFTSLTLGGFQSRLSGTHYNEVGVAIAHFLSVRTFIYANTAFERATGGVAAMPLLGPSSDGNQVTVHCGIQHFF